MTLLLAVPHVTMGGTAFKFRSQTVQDEFVCGGWHKFMKRDIYLQKS